MTTGKLKPICKFAYVEGRSVIRRDQGYKCLFELPDFAPLPASVRKIIVDDCWVCRVDCETCPCHEPRPKEKKP